MQSTVERAGPLPNEPVVGLERCYIRLHCQRVVAVRRAFTTPSAKPPP